jgi:N-acetylglutamate synthase-like GNAT family acetyltransferase
MRPIWLAMVSGKKPKIYTDNTAMWPVRQAERRDWKSIQDFFKNLDSESRYLYFGAHITDEVIDHIWDRFHLLEHKFFVVESMANIIGVCQIAHKDNHAELSVAVAANHRGRGIAHSLVERAVTWCKTHEIQDVMMFCLPSNDIIPKILKKHNLLPLMLSAPSEAKFSVPDANLLDLQKEWRSDIVSYWLNFFKKVSFSNRL